MNLELAETAQVLASAGGDTYLAYCISSDVQYISAPARCMSKKQFDMLFRRFRELAIDYYKKYGRVHPIWKDQRVPLYYGRQECVDDKDL